MRWHEKDVRTLQLNSSDVQCYENISPRRSSDDTSPHDPKLFRQNGCASMHSSFLSSQNLTEHNKENSDSSAPNFSENIFVSSRKGWVHTKRTRNAFEECKAKLTLSCRKSSWKELSVCSTNCVSVKRRFSKSFFLLTAEKTSWRKTRKWRQDINGYRNEQAIHPTRYERHKANFPSLCVHY